MHANKGSSWLKASSQAWYGKIAEYLNFCGYLASNLDASLFFKKKGSLHLIVLLYVDDMIITGNDDGEIAKLQSKLYINLK